ncbi:cold-inducible protein YdjO-related protein [Ectobacillus panaciterrae]|uniref:cold-inducible protein YdjO-related protein n=1 Tax=Ectobacillus panaciterrae TaxID=363872 RepID=UPI00040D1755|nr:cold-inducible protein YdjO-related protein [Ectobacillus panaciterrae]
MHWNKKKDAFQQEKKQEEVAVWECESDDCLGWMRKEFSFTDEPDCPLCGTRMKNGTRLLYVLPE